MAEKAQAPAAPAAPAAPVQQAPEPEPSTIQELEQQVTIPRAEMITEQRPPSTAGGVGGGDGRAFDGAVSLGSVGLQVLEALAVLAAIPAILSAGESYSFFRHGETRKGVGLFC